MNHLLSHRILCHGGIPRFFLTRGFLHEPPSSVYVVTHPWRSLLSDGEQMHPINLLYPIQKEIVIQKWSLVRQRRSVVYPMGNMVQLPQPRKLLKMPKA